MREGETQLRDGWCVAEQVPPAAFGTLAIYSRNEKETVDIVGSGPGEVVEFDGRDAGKDAGHPPRAAGGRQVPQGPVELQAKGQGPDGRRKAGLGRPGVRRPGERGPGFRRAAGRHHADAGAGTAAADPRRRHPTGRGDKPGDEARAGHGLSPPRHHLDSRLHAEGPRRRHGRTDAAGHAGQRGRGPDPQRRTPGGRRAALRAHRIPGAAGGRAR